jgi:hypothetical protein
MVYLWSMVLQACGHLRAEPPPDAAAVAVPDDEEEQPGGHRRVQDEARRLVSALRPIISFAPRGKV